MFRKQQSLATVNDLNPSLVTVHYINLRDRLILQTTPQVHVALTLIVLK